ncbi:MAG TPA: MoxR family ATPase [Ignavibacteriales bacterium]|nr:MoxR family ATPase [Ignavibacteriales bacterium]HOL81766.1 MoxR family ATPase [Ignavibacteriales bacterium]HOM65675.1 MoxR family ATPase [Ignavibacteriales bacterium]HPD67371.1 MoxR family ATPase [Ignavibacteriales bacterium]HPP32896.1 MoxR family ATPase [Ignavibacteriales bacterium]
MSISNEVEMIQELNSKLKQLKAEISKVIVGQDDIIEGILLSLLTKGHSLLIGVPGLAKTLIIKTLAEALGLSFNRIQFTPDLMPADITGAEILDEDPITKKKGFRFITGPIFANIILADEINRTPPKTQAALLEAMQEYKVTNAGTTYNLPQPFFVLATQNPIEQEGTYPLPEAQLDRFMFCLKVNYPSYEEECKIVEQTNIRESVTLKKVLNAVEIINYQNLINNIPVAENVIKYAVEKVRLTRPEFNKDDRIISENVRWGAGPRASIFLVNAAKALAVINNELTPSIEHVQKVANIVLRHRIILNFNAEAEGVTTESIIKYLFK